MAATSSIRTNIPIVKNQFLAATANCSIVVKTLCVLQICGYIVTLLLPIRFFVVTPTNVLPPNFWIWTYFTHCYLEDHLWIVLVNILVIILYGKLLEPLWGALEMVIFFILLNAAVALTSTVIYFFIYMITINPEYLYDTHIQGLAGYLAGFSVAVKQMMPDDILINTPLGKLRNRHLPIRLLIITILVYLIGGVNGSYPIMFGSGILVSWIYLRFYQKHNNGYNGDMAETFTFHSFFPKVTQPLIASASAIVFAGLVRVRICKKPQDRQSNENQSNGASTTITVNLPASADSERRRTLALKALNERLDKQMDIEDSWSEEDPDESVETDKLAEKEATIEVENV